MGMDFLDIKFQIEEEFHVVMSNDEMDALLRDNDITAGDLYALLLAKLDLEDVGRHDFRLNLALWTLMQHSLSAAVQVPLAEVQLHVPLDDLLPHQTRREAWDALRRDCP